MLKARIFLPFVFMMLNVNILLSQKVTQVEPRLLGISLQGGPNSCFADFGPGLHVRPLRWIEFSALFNNSSVQGFGYTFASFIYPSGYKLPFKKTLGTKLPIFFQPSAGVFYTRFWESSLYVPADSMLGTSIRIPSNEYIGLTIGAKLDIFSLAEAGGNLALVGGLSIRKRLDLNNAYIIDGPTNPNALSDVNDKIAKQFGFYVGLVFYLIKNGVHVKVAA